MHGSILPRWRGASPIQTAILEGDAVSGVTIIRMDEGMDTGDIIATSTVAIRNDDTGLSLGNILSQLGAKKLIEVLPKYIKGEIEMEPQNNDNATYSKMIRKTDGQLDFTENAEMIERKVRAFNPWPICHTERANRKIRIYKIEISEENNLNPGETGIFNKYPLIGTNSYDIILREVQPAGKQIMSGKNFLNGARDWID